MSSHFTPCRSRLTSVDGPATGSLPFSPSSVSARPCSASSAALALFFLFLPLPFAAFASCFAFAFSILCSFHARMTATLRSRLNCWGGLRNAVLSFGRRMVVRDSVCSRCVEGTPPGRPTT